MTRQELTALLNKREDRAEELRLKAEGLGPHWRVLKGRAKVAAENMMGAVTEARLYLEQCAELPDRELEETIKASMAPVYDYMLLVEREVNSVFYGD